jgi:hypothetical protein
MGTRCRVATSAAEPTPPQVRRKLFLRHEIWIDETEAHEVEARRREGYARELEDPDPVVITYCSAVMAAPDG